MSKFKLIKLKIAVFLILAALVAVVYWAYDVAPESSSPDKIKLVTYENNVLKEEENGALIWELKIGKMALNPVTQKATIEDVKGTFYGADGRNITLEAKAGEFNEATKNIKFTEGLKISSSDNLSFTSKELVWDNKQRVLEAIGDVIIKKPGLTAKANKASSKDNFTSFKLEGNARIIKGE